MVVQRSVIRIPSCDIGLHNLVKCDGTGVDKMDMSSYHKMHYMPLKDAIDIDTTTGVLTSRLTTSKAGHSGINFVEFKHITDVTDNMVPFPDNKRKQFYILNTTQSFDQQDPSNKSQLKSQIISSGKWLQSRSRTDTSRGNLKTYDVMTTLRDGDIMTAEEVRQYPISVFPVSLNLTTNNSVTVWAGKGDKRKIEESRQLPTGSYFTTESLIEVILSAFTAMSIRNRLSTISLKKLLSIVSNKASSKVCLELAKFPNNRDPRQMDWVILAMAPTISIMMGFEKISKVVGLRKEGFTDFTEIYGVPLHEEVLSPFVSDMQEGVSYMNVLCDLVEPSMVNQGHLNILTQVRMVSGPREFKKSSSESNAEEERVLRSGTFDRLTIECQDPDGKPIRFADRSPPLSLCLKIKRHTKDVRSSPYQKA